MKVPNDFKSFPCNGESKQMLFNFIHTGIEEGQNDVPRKPSSLPARISVQKMKVDDMSVTADLTNDYAKASTKLVALPSAANISTKDASIIRSL